MSTAQLRREISHLRGLRPPRRPAIPEDLLEFAHSLGIVPDSWQERMLRSEAPRVLLNCARQSGKSTMAGIVALHRALTVPGSLVLILAPAERQAKELFTKVAQAYRVLGHLVPAESYRKLGAELVNGSRIEALPGTEKTIRGFSGVDLLLVDEASRVADELYYAVRPMLAVSGGSLMMLSTPCGKRGVFFEEWTNGIGWERYEVPAGECPRISDAFLEEERRSLPRRVYRQEYECSFEETDDQVFSFQDVAAAISKDVTPLFESGAGRAREELVHYYIGLDLGQAQDYTALAFLEEALWIGEEVDWDSWGVYWPEDVPRSGGWVSPSALTPRSALRALYVNHHLGRPPHPPLYLRHLERYELGTKYTEIVARVKRLLLRSPVRERLDYSWLLIDSTGVGRPVVDSFKAEGIRPISITIHGGSAVTHQLEGPLLDGLRVPKRDLVAAVQTLLQNGRLQIAEALALAEVLKRELLSFRVKVDPRTAHDSYEHWREADHDDLVLAVACAAWYREHTNREIEAHNHRQGGYRAPF